MITDAQLRAALVFWLPYVVVASVCLAAGLSAFVLSTLRSRDRLLLWIGIFATLYAFRLFCETDLVRIALDIPSPRRAIALITYIIPIPYLLFFRELLGRGRKPLQIWLWIQIAFAAAAIPMDLLTNAAGFLSLANNAVVIGGTVLVLLPVLIQAGAMVPAAVRYSILAVFLFTIINNLGFRPGGRNIEPLGFLVLIGGLGYAAAQRALTREKKLAAVESELETARRIQSSILPRSLPELPGLRVAASYRPMAAVAGDFYDFITLGEGQVTVLVADVSGHGVPAALIASMLKVAFAQQSLHAADPASVLAGLNRTLNGVLDGQFVTAACAYIDLGARAITYAGAGHPPAILARQAGELIELDENGLFLGPFRHATYANRRVPFEPGDRLLLYTDGIIEATFVDGEPFGAARLRDFAAQRGVEPGAFVEALMNKVSIGEQEDDLTVVLAQAS